MVASPGRPVDVRDVAAGERGVPDVPRRRRRDAVRAATLRVIEDLHRAGRRIEPAEDAGLAREPEDAVGIEDRGVQVRAGPVAGEREGRDLVGVGIDPDDRVQAAVGDPGVAVRAR